MHSRAGVGQSVSHGTSQSACGEGLHGAEQAEQSAGERYLQAFEQALERLSQTVCQAAGREGSWLARVRAGLVAFLGFLDDEPGWGALLVREAPVPDAAVALGREQRVLGVLAGLMEAGREQAVPQALACSCSSLLDELLAGGVFAVIRARVLEGNDGPLVELAPSLMAFIVLPYLGQAAAQTELLGMPAPAQETPPDPADLRSLRLPVRATHRTMLVLRAIAAAPHSSNRQVAQIAGLSDEGQTSKLLARLAQRGVIENVGVGAPGGEPNAWTLTADGRRVLRLTGGVPSAGSPRRRSGLAGERRAA